jgi:hypothetical protein
MCSSKIISLVILVLSIATSVLAQPESRDILDQTYLEYVDRLPKNLISEKSIGVLIADNRASGQKMATEVHPTFAKAGVDVVAYYHVDDLFGGTILSKPLSAEMVKREVLQLVFIIKKAIGYKVVITPFSKDERFVKHGKKAWRMESNQLSEITDQIYRMCASLDRRNFLISDKPEYGRFNYRVKGQRYEAYKPDLKTQKLAVPMYMPIVLPGTIEGKVGLEKTRSIVNQYNLELIGRNEAIKSAFKDYPYPHVFIEEPLTHKQLKDKGFNYVLQRIHATSNTVRDLLKYEQKPGVTDYISVRMKEGKGDIVRLKGDVPAYKYYIKSIAANSYYLGAKWDADLTDEGALNNHVQLLTAEIR